VTGRAVAIWAGLLVIAVANGALRDVLIVPRLGPQAGHVISTLVLSAVIVVVAFVSIRWIAPPDRAGALRVGGLWMVLTLAFELLAGHWLFGKSWSDLFADYDLAAGRVWILVLVATLLAPAWAFARTTSK
jgi:hypothetical protein